MYFDSFALFLLLVLIRYSYGPVTLEKTTKSASIDLSFNASYWDSSVRVYRNTLGLGRQNRNELIGTFSSNVSISLAEGTQTALFLKVTNLNSGVTLEYDLTVIRPWAECTDSQLSQW